MFIEVHWTTNSIEEARKVAKHLLEQRLIACAQIIPVVESHFLWKNLLDTAQECKIIFKTHRNQYEKIRTIIETHAEYEVPEIVWIQIGGGNEPYLDWINASMSRTGQ